MARPRAGGEAPAGRLAPLLILLAAMASLLAPPVSSADGGKGRRETAETDDQSELLPRVSLGTLSEVFDAADEAQLFTVWDESKRVSFEEVLANPDDIPLNFRYAQTQVQDGNLRGASTTLERILLVEPDLPRTRLFYAVVLFRLGNIDEAEREFRKVAELNLSPRLRREVETYLGRIARHRRRNRFWTSLTLGSQYDSNRNASPRSKQALFLDTPIDLTQDSLREDDWSFLGVVNGNFARDLGSQRGHKLTAEATLFLSEQLELQDLSLGAVTLDVGGHFHVPFVDLRPNFFGSYVTLSRETYIAAGGFELQATHRVSDRLSFAALARIEHQHFEAISTSPQAFERSGTQFRGEVGGDYIFSPKHRGRLRFAYTDKHAYKKYHAYLEAAGYLNYTWLLGRGQFVSGTASLVYDKYKAPDPFVSNFKERNTRVRIQLIYGAPLGFFFFGRGEWLGLAEDIMVALRGEYLRSFSNLINYEYENWTGALMLTKRFAF